MTGHRRSRAPLSGSEVHTAAPSVPRVTDHSREPRATSGGLTVSFLRPLSSTPGPHRPPQPPTPGSGSEFALNICSVTSEEQTSALEELRTLELLLRFLVGICTALTQMSLSLWALTTVVQVWEVSPFPEQLLGLIMYSTPLGGRFVVWTSPLPPRGSFPIWRAKLND